MKKTVYVIPGSTESTKKKRYKKALDLFRKKGFRIIEVRIIWKNKTMTDCMNQFLKTKPKKGSYVFGFSYGAMIALISASSVKPKTLILCSLSPYFKEDLTATRHVYGKKFDKYCKKHDFEDLKKYSFNKIAKHVKCRTILIAGDKETVVSGKNYPLVLNRALDAKKRIKNSSLVIIKNGKHDISQKQYHDAIKKVIYKL